MLFNICATLFLIFECGISHIKLQKIVKSLFYFNIVKSLVLSVWAIGECLDPSTATWAAWFCFIIIMCEFMSAVITLRIVGLTNRYIGMMNRMLTKKLSEEDIYYY